MSIPVDGVDFLLYINTGDESTPSWSVLGGQRGATFKRQADEIDASSKTSNGWKDTIPGLRSWGIEADALVLDNDAAFEKLDECYMNRSPVQVRYARKDGSKWEGKATITDLSEDTPHDDVATYKLTLSGIGAPVKTLIK
jgi:TP901-1 family phage major tail protein